MGILMAWAVRKGQTGNSSALSYCERVLVLWVLQGLDITSPNSSWGVAFTGGIWCMRVEGNCMSQGLSLKSRRGQQEAGSPNHFSFLRSLYPRRGLRRTGNVFAQQPHKQSSSSRSITVRLTAAPGPVQPGSVVKIEERERWSAQKIKNFNSVNNKHRDSMV